jgi:hypothetical protein
LDYLSNSSCMSLQFLFCYIQLQTSGKSQLTNNITAEQYSDVFSQFNASTTALMLTSETRWKRGMSRWKFHSISFGIRAVQYLHTRH